MKTHVDQTKCMGHGMCEMNAPDVFTVNDSGVAEALEGELPPELVEDARVGAQSCPERAISLDS